MVESSSPFSRPSGNFVSKHVKPDTDQDQGPQPPQTNEIDNAKIIEQEQDTQTNQDDRANRTLLAPGLQRVGRNFSTIFGLGCLHGFEGSVENEAGEQNAKHGLETPSRSLDRPRMMDAKMAM